MTPASPSNARKAACNSLDEQISRDVLFNRLGDVPPLKLVVIVVDASNLERNLYYATQVIELGCPGIVVLNMMDVAEENGHQVDGGKLSATLGVPVVPMVASRGEGIEALRRKIVSMIQTPVTAAASGRFWHLPSLFSREVETIARLHAKNFPACALDAEAEALLILSDEKALASSPNHYPGDMQQAVRDARHRLESAGLDWRSAAIEARYARVAQIHHEVTTQIARSEETFSDKLDRIVTHRFWGVLIFVGIMTLMFQSIFTFARIPMEAIQSLVENFGAWVGGLIPQGDLNSLLVAGVIAGVGAVIVFLPQILLLFLFIGFLEDTGYMARAAFLMDRLMSKVGLHGKSFIPMLSSFACAIPGIMATRTIETPKDRLVTILVAPLMSCSARLPVYTLLIGACIPDERVLGFVKLQGLTMLTMYLLGVVVALLMAWLFKKTLLKGETPLLIMELPPYKRPLLRVVLRHMWDRSKLFLRRAGTVILGINILLWGLATYPRANLRPFNRSTVQSETQGADSTIQRFNGSTQNELAGEQLRNSFAGKMGRAIEPMIAPLGFDWKMGIGIVASFAAREVFVSTMSTVYNIGGYDRSESGIKSLAETLRLQKKSNGSPVYTPLVAVTLMVFYVFALQCASTVAVVRRETNSWKWPLFQWLYMGALAWVLAFMTYQGGRLLGFE
ncbi:MAG: ferrous iron transport protein B [Verrucomicrobia bacterium]|nr:MAG: ferrous iron transport protein B [Verrucomicrobiota bacterium]